MKEDFDGDSLDTLKFFLLFEMLQKQMLVIPGCSQASVNAIYLKRDFEHFSSQILMEYFFIFVENRKEGNVCYIL